MKRLLLLIVVFLLGSLVASLCGCSPIMNGEISSKEFIPEHEIEVDDPDIEIGDITIPGGSHMETVPDAWYITFGKVDEDGKYKSRTIQVDQATYDSHQEGDWINFER